ncbi:uncharacterized protein LOC106052362 isoform X2 [Biomphalaria glabrata]|uniref:Uncharacterized protein LOC106052362 isoform X2 n=1 Tax=Biomphalaria glabrata TaxID=6526 RepID=A0A9W2ZCP3_BIOGL|nr:uncharacterized protein LOC106052362 isoform X2 [Biomphalaria glabrata]
MHTKIAGSEPIVTMDLKTVAFLLLALSYSVNSTPVNGTQRFQAEKFLDMLSRSFDPNVAYMDLMSALNKRIKETANNSSGGGFSVDAGPNSMVDSVPQCPLAPAHRGAAVSYTSENRAVGSRAFYQCEAGYEGRSLFIQCNNGGVWSVPTGWGGCKAVDCGTPPPSVLNADSAYTTTTFGSVVTYTCQAGYKADKPNPNVTCLDTGYWGTPTFTCQKANTPALRLPSLQKAFNKNLGVQHLFQLQELASTLIKARQPEVKKPRPLWPASAALLFRTKSLALPPRPPQIPANQKNLATQQNVAMSRILTIPQNLALLKNLASPQRLPNFPNSQLAAAVQRNQMMAALLKSMPGFSGFPGMPSVPQVIETTTTTTPKPTIASRLPNGFQLPSHLQSLLPKPQDLMTLASLGLGSGTAGAAPRDITSLLGSMNPMSIFGPAMGLGTPGAGAGGAPGNPAAPPLEPEKVAEQREEMMLRAMMANAMKSMYQPAAQTNGTSTRPTSNPAMEMMTLMALQSGLSAGGAGANSASGTGMDPMAMMLGGMNPAMLGLGGGGASSGGLFGSLFA